MATTQPKTSENNVAGQEAQSSVMAACFQHGQGNSHSAQVQEALAELCRGKPQDCGERRTTGCELSVLLIAMQEIVHGAYVTPRKWSTVPVPVLHIQAQ